MDRYMPGVPCWVDTSQPDPAAAAEFYEGLFGWDLEDRMPPESDARYFVATIGDDAAGAVTGPAEGPAVWNTYVWVDSADASAEKVRAAGGTVVSEPADVGPAGRMAVCRDPDGAEFRLWEPGQNRGATVVNQHGAVNFNGLEAADVEGARRFYGELFGWGTIEMGPGVLAWTLPGYGDLLERLNPGTRERNAQLGAPPGFEDVVATVQAADGGAPPRWGVTFGIDDADAAAATARELGGTVISEPEDLPWVRMTVITDPQGATFAASQFKPENR